MIDFDALKHVWQRGLGDMKDEQQQYELPPGRFPSVTQVLNGYSDFLWVHLTKIEQYINELVMADACEEEVDTWIDASGNGEWVKVKVPALACLKDGKHVAYEGLRFMKAAGDRGMGVHFLFEAWGEGIRPEPEQAQELAEWMVMEQCRKANVEELALHLASAIRWLDAVQPEFQMQEMIVFDPFRCYAGRTDARLATIDGVLCIPDIKSHDKFKRTWAMQLAAYRACPQGFGCKGDKLEHVDILPEWKTVPGCSIMVTPERTGHRFIQPTTMDYYRDRFYSALDAYEGVEHGPLTGKAKWIKSSLPTKGT